nr:MAG TPA: SOS-response transcriptional repressor [Caudoviricetes sp.]
MGCWIQYQLKLRGYTHDAVALKSNRSVNIVSQFLNGRKGSIPTQKAICEVLGYADFNELLAAMPEDCKTEPRKGA